MPIELPKIKENSKRENSKLDNSSKENHDNQDHHNHDQNSLELHHHNSHSHAQSQSQSQPQSQPQSQLPPESQPESHAAQLPQAIRELVDRAFKLDETKGDCLLTSKMNTSVFQHFREDNHALLKKTHKSGREMKYVGIKTYLDPHPYNVASQKILPPVSSSSSSSSSSSRTCPLTSRSQLTKPNPKTKPKITRRTKAKVPVEWFAYNGAVINMGHVLSTKLTSYSYKLKISSRFMAILGLDISFAKCSFLKGKFRGFPGFRLAPGKEHETIITFNGKQSIGEKSGYIDITASSPWGTERIRIPVYARIVEPNTEEGHPKKLTLPTFSHRLHQRDHRGKADSSVLAFATVDARAWNRIASLDQS